MPTGLNKDGKWVSSSSVLKDMGIPVDDPSPLWREADEEIKRLKSAVAWQKKTIAARDERICKLEDAIYDILNDADPLQDVGETPIETCLLRSARAVLDQRRR